MKADVFYVGEKVTIKSYLYEVESIEPDRICFRPSGPIVRKSNGDESPGVLEVGMSRIYVASSWRNEKQPSVVSVLRRSGHEVYDFKNPRAGNHGFHWSEIDPDWQNWTTEAYRECLNHPIAEAGFKSDFDAMKWADTFILVLPCGRSAHLEMGWACGAGKRTAILLDKMEPELMVKMCNKLLLSQDEMLQWVNTNK
jgi:hypothetical protein